MNIFNYKKRNIFSIGPHLLGLMFLLIGIFIALSPYIIKDDNSDEKAFLVGGIAIVFGLVVLLSFSGVLIDFNNKKYKDYYSLAGIKLGQWKDLPQVRAIKLVSDKFKASGISNGVNPALSGNVEVHRLFLYSQAPKPFIGLEYPDKESALSDAKVLSEKLNIILAVA